MPTFPPAGAVDTLPTDLTPIWEEQCDDLHAVAAMGGFQAFINAKVMEDPSLAHAFMSHGRRVCCIDERITDGDGIRIPGSGILMQENDLLDSLHYAGVSSVTSHTRCGAVRASLLSQLQLTNPNTTAAMITEDQVEEAAKHFAKDLACKLNVPYEGHLAFDGEGMTGPSDVHIARMTFYDGTNSLNTTLLQHILPPAFVVSRNFHPLREAQRAVEVSFNIALHSGFGARITEDEPFFVVAVARSEAQREKLCDELAPLLRKHGALMRCDSIVSPTLAFSPDLEDLPEMDDIDSSQIDEPQE